jgi:hypothetical protein
MLKDLGNIPQLTDHLKFDRNNIFFNFLENWDLKAFLRTKYLE